MGSGKTPTSPILEDPISGSDPLVGDLLDVVRSDPPAPLRTQRERANSLERGTEPLCPAPLVAFARWVGPF